MNRIAIAVVVGALVTAIAAIAGQDAPQPPAAQKEHKWLEQLAGTWEYEAEGAISSKGTESARMLGGFWLVSELKGNLAGMALEAVMTVGYDPKAGKYISTWVDSTNSHLWNSQGTVDAAGKVLTLQAEGPNPDLGGKMSKFRDVIELKSKDHKVVTSSMQGEDGKWNTFMTAQYRRKK